MIKLNLKEDTQLQYMPADIFTRWREFNHRTHAINHYMETGINCETHYENNFEPAFTFLEGEFQDLVEFIKNIDQQIIDVYYTTIFDSQLHIPKDVRKQYYICYHEDFELSVFMDEESIELPF
jgi:uncharacterized protein YqgV (UPF0045/DUF77 family)